MNNDLLNIISILNELGINNNVILIGSWVEFFYKDLIKNYYSQFVTQDYDFLVKRPVKKGKGFISKMKEIGFDYSEDYLTNKSKFYKDGMEVEFLTNLTRDNTNICAINEMGINAEVLKNVDILLNNTIVVECKTYKITIPSPAAYCIHKLLINPSRIEWKKQKDIDSVINILSKMIDSNVYINEVNHIFDSLGKKQKKTIEEICNNYNIVEFDKIRKLTNN